MAVVRARSSPPYGLFAAVFFAVVMAAWAIVMTVLWSGSSGDKKAAEDDLSRVASAQDVAWARSAGLLDPKNPAVKQLQGQVKSLKEMIAGANAASSVDELKADADLKAALEKYRSLKGAVSAMMANLGDQSDQFKRMEALAKQAGDRAAAAEKQLLDATNAYQQSNSQLTAQNTKLQQDLAAANQSRDQAVAAGQDAVSKAQTAAEESRRTLVLELEQSKQEITKRESELAELRQRVLIAFGHGAEPNVGEPDGTIRVVDAAAGEVYIDLTRKDGIVPGMTFTVYDPRVGVRFGTDEAAMGNGSIEVREVGDKTSVCRITHTTPGHAIQANDLIANLVYHNNKSRKLRFVVIGDFDLDGDGVATAAERDRLVSMIVRWGGQVDSEVTSQTDYLVAGKEPSSPTIIQEQPADAAATAPGTVPDERSKQQVQYNDLIFAAKRLSIPVLNANRFLSMIGYYNTTIVRY